MLVLEPYPSCSGRWLCSDVTHTAGPQSSSGLHGQCRALAGQRDLMYRPKRGHRSGAVEDDPAPGKTKQQQNDVNDFV